MKGARPFGLAPFVIFAVFFCCVELRIIAENSQHLHDEKFQILGFFGAEQGRVVG